MVDNASGSGRETGRSQRPKSRVDYTSQIYINVPSKAVTAPVTSSKPKLRNSKGSNRQSTHSTKKQKLKNSPPANCHVLRGSQGSAGKSKPLRGNVLCDQSNVTATDSRLGPSIEAKASKLVHDSSGEGKRRRADGRLHEAKPATPTPELELPKRKKRRNTGCATPDGPADNIHAGLSQSNEHQGNSQMVINARSPTLHVSEPTEPTEAARQHVSHQLNVACPGDALAGDDLQLVQDGAMGDLSAAAKDGTGWTDVDAIFSKQYGQATSIPEVSQTDFERLGQLLDETSQQRIHVAQQEVRVLTAEKEQQASCIRHLRAEIDRLESRNRQHEVEASKQLQRVKVNYQILYDKFNKLRGQNFEEAQDVLEEIWESLEERSDMANQLIDSWKGDAEKHKRLLRHSALPAASQELQIKQNEVLELKNKLLEEAEASLLQAQEIANLRHLVNGLESVRPQTADVAVQAQPEVCVGTTQTPGEGRQFSMVSPLQTVQRRRRTRALDVTSMARSLVPEGAGVCSVDTNVLRMALLKPTEPSQASGPIATGTTCDNATAATHSPEADRLVQPETGTQIMCFGVTAAQASAVPAVRFSSSVRPQKAQGKCAFEMHNVQSNSRGSNAVAPGRSVVTPQERALVLRDAEQPVRSDPGPGIPSNVAEVGDTHEPSLENCQDGCAMSTSESDQRYGDADGEFRENNAICPLVIDHSGGGGCGVSAGAQEPVAETRDVGATGGLLVAPFAMGTPARTSAGIRICTHGDLDSERSTDFQSQMRMFRDRMLSMEVIQSPYGTAFQCRDLKSGFTFTIKPCINSAPPIRVPDHGGTQEVADELTYVPDMNICPEHVKAKLPQVFQEEFDFRADHLHGLQKRIDRALEVVNGNL